MEFLSLEEVNYIDRCPLSSREKFLTRLTISAWHLLEHISKSCSRPIEALQSTDIIHWFEEDQSLPWQGEYLDFPDTREDEVSQSSLPSYQKFLCRIVIQARVVLISISQSLEQPIEELTLEQILAWIEQECVRQRALGEEPAFLRL
ncbi:MAG: hypothetical protein LDL47_05815 [Cyanobacteria bacterium KgW148]|nr:hypothetical protein [Cyanobacteria bacterium KgW148]